MCKKGKRRFLVAKYKEMLILFLGLTLLFSGCMNLKQPRKTDKIEFYTLEYDPPTLNGLQPLSAVIRVQPFSVAPTYNTNRIIYRDRSFKRAAYVYHKWQDNPGDLVTYFLSRDMRQSGLFGAVLSRDSGFRSSYILEGSVEEFLERDTDDAWEAILSVSVVFITANESDNRKRILFQKTYHGGRLCKQKNPRALAEAMSRAMSEVSGEITKDIYDNLKDQR